MVPIEQRLQQDLFFNRSSHVKEARTGQSKEYDANPVRLFGMAVHHDRAEFETIDKMFSELKDSSGRSMLEIAKEYWDDPEKQRREIAEKKKRGY